MNEIALILSVVAAVLIYRHASGKQVLPKWLVIVLFIFSLLPCAVAYLIGTNHNPNRGTQ